MEFTAHRYNWKVASVKVFPPQALVGDWGGGGWPVGGTVSEILFILNAYLSVCRLIWMQWSIRYMNVHSYADNPLKCHLKTG